MAILRAPSQFSPTITGGPVTPSCCGCSCCCCCVGSAVATSVALPMVLHQITGPRRAAAPPAADPESAGRDGETVDEHRVGPGRRVAGIMLAALTIPAVLAVAIMMQQLRAPLVLSVVIAIGLGVGSYVLGGAKPASSMATPLLIMLLGAVIGFGELFLWIVMLFDDDRSRSARIVAGLAILAIPVATTTLLAVAGRRARNRMARV